MPRLAYVGTGGTISALGVDSFDLLDYASTDMRVTAQELIARSGLQGRLADILPVEFRNIDSTAITHDDWHALVRLCRDLARDPALDGIVIGHGTASLEETAYVLSLTLDLTIPVVLTGAMRPLSGISTDAFANLAAAVRLACAAAPGVFVVMNDEIHAPRHVTKAHNLGMGAFRSATFGPVGHVTGASLQLRRGGEGGHAGADDGAGGKSGFCGDLLRHLPRVDIVYSHVGADGALIGAAVAAGARGIVSAGFGPGMATPREADALRQAVACGVAVVQSSRIAAGEVVDSAKARAGGIIAAGDLGPPKARILLALCLARGDGQAAIAEAFRQQMG